MKILLKNNIAFIAVVVLCIILLTGLIYQPWLKDIRQAKIDDLDSVYSIGPEKAQDIYDYVQSHPDIESANQLYNYKIDKSIIKGIGRETIYQLKRCYR